MTDQEREDPEEDIGLTVLPGFRDPRFWQVAEPPKPASSSPTSAIASSSRARGRAPTDRPPGVKVTLSRLLFSVLTVGFGLAKAALSYAGGNASATTLDWILGVVAAVLCFWLEAVANENPYVMPWLLQTDYRREAWLVFKQTCKCLPYFAQMWVVHLTTRASPCSNATVSSNSAVYDWVLGVVVAAVSLWLQDDPRSTPWLLEKPHGAEILRLTKAAIFIAAHLTTLSTCRAPLVHITVDRPTSALDSALQTARFLLVFAGHNYSLQLYFGWCIPCVRMLTPTRPRSYVVSTLLSTLLCAAQAAGLRASSRAATYYIWERCDVFGRVCPRVG